MVLGSAAAGPLLNLILSVFYSVSVVNTVVHTVAYLVSMCRRL